MKTAAIVSFLFAGAALAVPVAEKRSVNTEVVVTTVWTTTTVFVDGPTGAAFFEKRPRTTSSSFSASSSTTAPPPPPSSAAPVPSVAAPKAAPSAEPVAEPVATAPASGSGSGSGSSAGASISMTGDVTYYSVSNGAAGSCGLTKSDGDPVVALSYLTMKNGANSNNNALCGKTVNIQGETGVYTATVYDTCEGCAAGDIDLSPSLFKSAFPHGDGRVKNVHWWI